MRIALLADIHANLVALEAVLADLDARGGIDLVHHLGDLVGYAPWPDETVALLRERAITGVAGNYDSTVASRHEHCGCRSENPRQEQLSHRSYEWTLEQVSESTRRYLGTLPFRIDVRPGGGHRAGTQLILVHGAPTVNTLYWTEDRPDSFCERMIRSAGARQGDVLAFGHTHLPWQRRVAGVQLVNAGSVGRPKDGDPRACYAIVEVGDDAVRVEHVRVAYDVARAADAIRASELPDELAFYLLSGGRSFDADPHQPGDRPGDPPGSRTVDA